VLTGELTIFAEDAWTTFGPGDYVHVPENGARFPQRRRRPVSFLILFAPGTPGAVLHRARADRRQGVELTPEERVAFYARHDQVNLDQCIRAGVARWRVRRP
jgi:hypothetical protein